MRGMISAVFAAGVVATSLMTSPAAAQQGSWPNRPVKVIVPFAPGGSADIIARAFVDQASAAVGQPMIVENRGGAGGNLGGVAVAKSAPDGYTLFFGSTGPAALNALMYKAMPYDPVKDFAPIILVGKTPVIIAARGNAPFANLKELFVYAKANPGKVTAGFPGNGTLGHITGVLFGQRAEVDIKHVQYRGGGAIINDLLGGHIDLSLDALTPYVPQVQDGKLKGLAVASAQRIKQLPDVPTVSESGLPGFEASVWYPLMAPTGTPPDIIAKLNKIANEFLRAPKTLDLFEKLGVIPDGGTPEAAKAFIAQEVERWRPVIKAANIEF